MKPDQPSSQAPSAARQRLLDTAAALFDAEGVRAVGINSILAVSGVAKDTLYKHFASKDDLVYEVLRIRDREWCDTLREGVTRRARDPEGRLLAVFDVLGDEFAAESYRGSAFINAAAEFPDPDHPVRRACAEHKARVLDYLRGLAGDANVRDPQALAEQLMLLIDGAICARVMRRDRRAAYRAREAAAILLAAHR